MNEAPRVYPPSKSFI